MKKLFPNILKNSFYLLCMNLSTLGALFIFSILLARILGKEALGLYTLFTAILMPFAYFVDLGQSTSLVQEICRSPNLSSKILKNTILVKIVLTFLATILLVLFSSFYFDNLQVRYLFWLFGLMLLPRAFYSTFEAVFRAHQTMAYPMWIGFVSGVLLVSGSWTMLYFGFSFRTIIGFLVGVEVSKAVLALGFYRKISPLHIFNKQVPFDIRLAWKLAKRSLTYFLLGIVGILYYRLDIMLLAAIKNTTEVGIFSAAANFVKVLRMIPSVVVAAYFPMISSLNKKSLQVKTLSFNTLRLQLGLSLMLALAVFVLSEWLIAYTFRIPEAVKVLKVFVWSLIPLSLYSTLIYTFFQADKSVWNIKVLSTTLILNVTLNFLLIPKLGAMALAVSNLVSESFCFIVLFGLYCYLVRNLGAFSIKEVSPNNKRAVTAT